MFVDNPNRKGAIAELEIELAATKLGIPVYKPVAEHGRADLMLEVGGHPYRVQCKWGRLGAHGDVIVVGVESNRCTSTGYVRSRYERHEIDLLAVYCGATDRCYLLPQSLFIGKRQVQLRRVPPKNGQRSCINLAEDYEFDGAVAQLARAPAWHAGGRGFESPQLHSEPPLSIGSDEFRNRLGYYLDLAAEGQELNITRWGKRFLKVTVWQPPLPDAHAA